MERGVGGFEGAPRLSLPLSLSLSSYPAGRGQLAGRGGARRRVAAPALGGGAGPVRAGWAADGATLALRAGRGRAGPAVEGTPHQGDQVAEGGGHLDDAQGAVVHGGGGWW